MREISTRLWTGLVNDAKVSIEKDAAVPCALQNSPARCVRIGDRVSPPGLFGVNPEILSDDFDVRLVSGHGRVAAAIRASSAVNLLLYLRCQYLKRFDSMMMSREIASEILILGLPGGSQLPDLHQIRNHAFSILLTACQRKRFAGLSGYTGVYRS